MDDKFTIEYMFGDGKVTAFYKEMPGLVVQGNGVEDVEKMLDALWSHYLKMLFNAPVG